jgi:hypothetical protein
MIWDVFISHASEDKEQVARPLSNILSGSGVMVWLDENELGLGDSLRSKIDQGLAKSRYGVVILSPSFFAKDWPQRELDGLVALDSLARKVILPVWHCVNEGDIAQYSPLLAGRLAVSTDKGLGVVANEILKIVIPSRAKELGLPLNNFFPEDRSLFVDLMEVFNRPAFWGTFLSQTDPAPFQRAIKITLKALNTGAVENNSGVIIKTIAPITRIRDAKLFASMQEVATQLKAVDNLIERLKAAPNLFQTDNIIVELDTKRDTIIKTLNKIWQCFGLHTLPIPTEITASTDAWESFPEPPS